MNTGDVTSLVKELDTTLGLLYRLVDELKTLESESGPSRRVHNLLDALKGQPNLQELPKLLFRAYNDITAALGGIRLTRNAIQTQTIDRLRDTHSKINQVSSETETVAMNMMYGLDRTMQAIDQLADGGRKGAEGFQEAVQVLRDEVNGLFNCLQFQDIIAQQLQGAADLLGEVEDRLEGVAAVFDAPNAALPEPASDSNGHGVRYDDGATIHGAEGRQELVDEALKAARAKTPSCYQPAT